MIAVVRSGWRFRISCHYPVHPHLSPPIPPLSPFAFAVGWCSEAVPNPLGCGRRRGAPRGSSFAVAHVLLLCALPVLRPCLFIHSSALLFSGEVARFPVRSRSLSVRSNSRSRSGLGRSNSFSGEVEVTPADYFVWETAGLAGMG